MASSCFLFQPPVTPLKLFAIAWLATALVALAAPVAIGDHSFEGNSLSAGGWSNNLGPEWLETAGPNSGSGFEEWIPGFPRTEPITSEPRPVTMCGRTSQ